MFTTKKFVYTMPRNGRVYLRLPAIFKDDDRVERWLHKEFRKTFDPGYDNKYELKIELLTEEPLNPDYFEHPLQRNCYHIVYMKTFWGDEKLKFEIMEFFRYEFEHRLWNVVEQPMQTARTLEETLRKRIADLVADNYNMQGKLNLFPVNVGDSYGFVKGIRSIKDRDYRIDNPQYIDWDPMRNGHVVKVEGDKFLVVYDERFGHRTSYYKWKQVWKSKKKTLPHQLTPFQSEFGEKFDPQYYLDKVGTETN